MQEVEKSKNTKRDKKKSRKTLWAVIVILVLIILALMLKSCGAEPQELQFSPSGEIVQGEIELMDQETLQNKVNEVVEKGMFQVFMNTKIQVDSQNTMNVKIQNNQSNHYDCYVIITMDGKNIYQSAVLSPGYKLERDTLPINLGEGTHECVAYFCVLNEEGNEINRIGLEITLTKGV